MTRTLSAGDDLAAGFAVVDGREAVRQRLVQRLRLFRGEAFMDADAGLDSEALIGRRLPSALSESIVRAAAQTVPGVERVTAASVTLDPDTRVLEISVSVMVEAAVVSVRVTM